MSLNETIIQSIQNIADLNNSKLPSVVIGTVLPTGPNDSSNSITIQPLDETLNPISNILLSMDPNPNAVPTFTPTVGTIVSVAMYGSSSGVVVGHGAVTAVSIAGNQNGGLVKVNPLVELLNAIKTYIDGHIEQYFNNHTHSTPSGPSGIPITLDTRPSFTVNQSNLENTTVTHGNGTQSNLSYQQQISQVHLLIDAQAKVVDAILIQYNNALSANKKGYNNALLANEKGVETKELAEKYIDANAKLAALQDSLTKLLSNPPAPSN